MISSSFLQRVNRRRVLNSRKIPVKCVARRGFRYGSEDIRVGILVGELLLRVCFARVSVDTDKTVSPSLFLRCRADISTNVKTKLSQEARACLAAIRIIGDLWVADDLWREILSFHEKLFVSSTAVFMRQPVTGPVLWRRGLRVGTPKWLATASAKMHVYVCLQPFKILPYLMRYPRCYKYLSLLHGKWFKSCLSQLEWSLIISPRS